MNTSLYVIATEYQQAMLKLMDSDLDEQTIQDTLEGMSGEIEVKATNVAMFSKNLRASAEAIKQAEAAMAERRKAIENKADKVDAYILENMVRCNMTEISCPHFTMKVKQNPPSVIVDDITVIPDDYMRIPKAPPPAPDKNLIATALKDGFEVPGCHLERGVKLEIK